MSDGMVQRSMALSDSPDYLKAISYEDTKAAKPPIPITVIPPPPSRDGVSNRSKTSPEPYAPFGKARSGLHHDLRRDSGMAPSSSTARDSRTTLATDAESLKNSPSLPRITIQDEAVKPPPTKQRKWSGYRARKADLQIEQAPTPDQPFLGITTDIPTGSFEDLTLPGRMDFSHRGSMLIGGKKANAASGAVNGHARLKSGRQPSISMLAALPHSGGRVLSADDVMLSQKVRSMYESGNAMEQNNIAEMLVGVPYVGANREAAMARANGSAHLQAQDSPRSKSSYSDDRVTPTPVTIHRGPESTTGREETELAGGIEDWEDVQGGDVDRYGFIVPRRLPSQGSSMVSGHATSPDAPRIQRVSTLLLLASEAPRRKRSTLHRTPSKNGTARSVTGPAPTRQLSGRSLRPRSSGSSYQGSLGGTSSRFRQATNRLPYNKDRRWKDEAGDMLTLPPGLANIAENDEGSKAALDLKRKEWEREEKWRKMAQVVKRSPDGGGMVFEFDTRSPKLIERTWKGIPDRWRATAWHAFLTSSAKRRGGLPSDDELVAAFHRLLELSSPDDVQIDIDVPRTINSHIMFRRRYRGGQRLLFRVLHALSLYFPDTGYVQGMASLVATLLCYYEEETAFVMLVRLWQLRGLDRLYQSGFDGLMEALDEFEKKWLAGGDVAARLVCLSHPEISS